MKVVIDTNTLVSGLLWPGNPSLIITGDKDLLTMKSFAGTPIVDAAEALRRLGLS